MPRTATFALVLCACALSLTVPRELAVAAGCVVGGVMAGGEVMKRWKGKR